MPLDATPPDASPRGRCLSDADVARLCAALAPLQSLDAEARSVGCAPSVPSGTRDPDAARAALLDTGAVTRGRAAWRRLAAVAPEARELLLVVAEVAHARPSVDALALHVGKRVRRDLAIEARVDAAAAQEAQAEKDEEKAEKALASALKASHALSPAALVSRQRRDGAVARRDGAAARRREAAATIVARGLSMLVAALAAWDATADAGE